MFEVPTNAQTLAAIQAAHAARALAFATMLRAIASPFRSLMRVLKVDNSAPQPCTTPQ